MCPWKELLLHNRLFLIDLWWLLIDESLYDLLLVFEERARCGRCQCVKRLAHVRWLSLLDLFLLGTLQT